MEIKVAGGNNLIVKVLPSEVKHLQDEEVIIVSRAQINAQLAFVSMDINNKQAKDDIKILKCAINEMMIREKKQRAMVMGAEMKVREVKQIFSKIEEMPANSFAKIM